MGIGKDEGAGMGIGKEMRDEKKGAKYGRSEDDLEIRMGGVRSGIEGRKGFEMDWSGIWAYGGEDRGGGMDWLRI
ncbi:hypothetical protein U1Q18_046986 [Sarracenia purpurea var. burkii]